MKGFAAATVLFTALIVWGAREFARALGGEA